MSLLLDLQSAVATRLESIQSDEGLPMMPVLTEAKGDLDNQIRQRILKAGGGLTVLTPQFQAGEHPDQIVVDLVIVLTLNVTMDNGPLGSRKTATELGELLYGYLHSWQPEDESWTALQFQSWALRDAIEEGQLVVYTATFRTSTITTITDES